jgi:hypothetical protein
MDVYDLLKHYTIPLKNQTNNRRGFPAHRSMTLGISKARFSGTLGLSYYSKKYPDLYSRLLEYGKGVCSFPFQSIHINHNVICPPHTDSNNQQLSCVVSVGNYSGGELVINGIAHDTKTPIEFNGAKHVHYNLPHTGDKYSIVFY